MRPVWIVGLLAPLLCGLALASPPKHLKALCASCHGADGNSSTPEHPVLAGQAPGYLLRQLQHFKSGERKNPVMAEIVAPLSEQDMASLADYFAEHKPSPRPAGAAGEAGTELARGIFEKGVAARATAACSSCHGADGEGDSKHPRIASQHEAYVLRQLQAFKANERRTDAQGVMRAAVRHLSDDELRQLARYVATLSPD